MTLHAGGRRSPHAPRWLALIGNRGLPMNRKPVRLFKPVDELGKACAGSCRFCGTCLSSFRSPVAITLHCWAPACSSHVVHSSIRFGRSLASDFCEVCSSVSGKTLTSRALLRGCRPFTRRLSKSPTRAATRQTKATSKQQCPQG